MTKEVTIALDCMGGDNSPLIVLEGAEIVAAKNKDVNFQLILKNCNNIWKDNLIKLGGDYLIWSNSPENPNHN